MESREGDQAHTEDSGSWPAIVLVLLVIVLIVVLFLLFKFNLFNGGTSNTVVT